MAHPHRCHRRQRSSRRGLERNVAEERKLIAVIPGDGVGPEVVDEGLKVLAKAAELFNFSYSTKTYPFGADHYLATKEFMPEGQLDEFRSIQDCSHRFRPVTAAALNARCADPESGFIGVSEQRPPALSIPLKARVSEAMNIRSQTTISPLRWLFRLRK